MDDLDGPSRAAHGAQPDDGTQDPDADRGIVQSGFLRRLRNLLSGKTADQDAASGAADAASNGRPQTGLLNLRRMRVEDVVIPRAEIIAVPATITKTDLVEVFRKTGLTRLPVYDGTLDTPLGFVHLKDFALSHGFDGGAARFNLKKMLRPLLFVPPSMPIGVLLAKMQAERRHMALVIDEYGGVDGLVTIEDLIEQVIGEIEDEHDTEDTAFITKERSGSYLALARTPLDEFESETGLSLSDVDIVDSEEVDTLGGLVFVLAGHVPARGEVVPHPKGYEFEVVEADPRRIKRLRVRMPGGPRPAPASQPAAAADAARIAS